MKCKISVKRSQKISLEILKKTTDLCEQLGLRYYLMYGTLIGAIRHNGYIPWDDDTDIMMPRNDFDRLINYIHDNPDSLGGLELFDYRLQREYPYMIARISNLNFEIKMKNERSYGMGIFIDIYPFDGLGNKLEEAVKIERKGDILSSFCYLSTRKHFAIESTKGLLRNIVKFPLFIIAKIVGKNYFQCALKKLENNIPYDLSKYICCVVWASGGQKDIFLKSWFDDYEYHIFEDYEFRIPKNYDVILKHIYGDYMTLPPKSERIGHHYYEVENEKN